MKRVSLAEQGLIQSPFRHWQNSREDLAPPNGSRLIFQFSMSWQFGRAHKVVAAIVLHEMAVKIPSLLKYRVWNFEIFHNYRQNFCPSAAFPRARKVVQAYLAVLHNQCEPFSVLPSLFLSKSFRRQSEKKIFDTNSKKKLEWMWIGKRIATPVNQKVFVESKIIPTNFFFCKIRPLEERTSSPTQLRRILNH